MFDPDSPTVRLDDQLAECQAEAAIGATRPALALHEALEYALALLGGQTGAKITHPDLHPAL
jgi:hypothetical protein